MLLDLLIAWNLSAKVLRVRNVMKSYDLFKWVAGNLLNSCSGKVIIKESMNINILDCNELKSKKDARCIVCYTDSKLCDKNVKNGIRSKVFFCKGCNISIHVHKMEYLRNIHSYFPGQTWYEIMMSLDGKDIWQLKSNEQKKEKFYLKTNMR